MIRRAEGRDRREHFPQDARAIGLELGIKTPPLASAIRLRRVFAFKDSGPIIVASFVKPNSVIDLATERPGQLNAASRTIFAVIADEHHAQEALPISVSANRQGSRCFSVNVPFCARRPPLADTIARELADVYKWSLWRNSPSRNRALYSRILRPKLAVNGIGPYPAPLFRVIVGHSGRRGVIHAFRARRRVMLRCNVFHSLMKVRKMDEASDRALLNPVRTRRRRMDFASPSPRAPLIQSF